MTIIDSVRIDLRKTLYRLLSAVTSDLFLWRDVLDSSTSMPCVALDSAQIRFYYFIIPVSQLA